MENYIVSARKYRPIDFKSVVGQTSITTTLKNSIKTKQLAHAYLFCGPRGVGKTTCARLFAKTINCENPTNDFEACNECESCKAFIDQRSYNIHELDAASNNSVEDIRNLIEQVRIPPQIGTHSVYIIDEVHMLSAQAFNAFLKTLEEPPSYAIFVLATTEKHKILPTILSRCQIFDFNRIKVNDTVEYLEYVAKNEEIEYEVDALNIIAQKSDGALRDALSFFDQIVSFSGKNITYKSTIENLNVLDYDYYFKITDFILQNNLTNALLTFNEILENGFDGHHFITGLSTHFRDLMVSKDQATINLLEVGEVIKEKYLEQSQKCNLSLLIKLLEISNKTDLAYRASKNKRLQVELALMQMCNVDSYTEQKKKSEPGEKKQEILKPKGSLKKQDSEEKENIQEKKKNVAPKLKKSGISLNGNKEIQTVNEKNSSYSQSEDLGENDLERDKLNIAWDELVSKFEKQPRLYNALKSKKLKIKDQNTAVLKVSNNSLAQALINIKTRIVSYLRKKLDNKNFDLDISVEEDDENNSEHLYTDKDKYKYLVNKNPNLDKLKTDFDLDF